MVGGAAAPRSMIQTLEEEYDVRVVHGWGMTELSPVGTLSVPKAHMQDWPAEKRYAVQGLQGRPLYGVDMRIVDADGRELPHDGTAAGALQVRGPWVAGGYYRGDNPESFTADGWFNTGDVAAIDAEGFLRLTDRTKDVIKSGGEWISSIEIENVAVSHPAVQEAACIAITHSKWGERPLLVVVPKAGAAVDKADLLAFFEGKVAKWWIPDDVAVVEELPHTATGKLYKLGLRERFRDFVLPPTPTEKQEPRCPARPSSSPPRARPSARRFAAPSTTPTARCWAATPSAMPSSAPAWRRPTSRTSSWDAPSRKGPAASTSPG